MPFTRGAREVPNQTPASNTDARKRKAEKDQRTIEVKVDVDTDELREWAGKHADAGQAGVAHVLYATARQLETGSVPAFLDGGETPPPAPREPWRGISTGRDKPTLAKVVWNVGNLVETRLMFRNESGLYDADSGFHIGPLHNVTHVEVLHTFSPETHVPVERALIDEAAGWHADWLAAHTVTSGVRAAHEIIADLAALADGAEKGVDS